MNRIALACVVAAGLWIGGCSNTVAPTTTNTPTTPTSLITPATTVLPVGQTQTYSLASGTSANVITWTSSNSGVLTIDSTGMATAVASGVATITASSDNGTTATLAVQVVPNYQGSWSGTATVLACTDIGGFASANYCAQIRGSVQRWTLVLSQAGLTVSGTMTLSQGANVLSGPMTGAIGASGDIISLTGSLAGLANGTSIVVTPISWDSLASDGKLTGGWAANVTSQQILGVATVQWSLTGATQ